MHRAAPRTLIVAVRGSYDRRMGWFSSQVQPGHTASAAVHAPLQPSAGGAESRAARKRARRCDPDALAIDFPEALEGWANGRLSSAWVTHALDSQGFYGLWIGEALELPEAAVDGIELGLLYPGWDVLCRLWALVDQKPGSGILSDRDAPPQLDFRFGRVGRFGTALSSASMYLASHYHPALVRATVEHGGTERFAAEYALALERAQREAHQFGPAFVDRAIADVLRDVQR